MAKHFDDNERAERIRTAENNVKAEEEMKGLKFDEAVWQPVYFIVLIFRIKLFLFNLYF